MLGAMIKDRSQQIVILFHKLLTGNPVTSYMKRYRLCFLGFGNVGRALARLFVSKTAELRDNYGIEWEITGVATRRMGWRASDDAIDVNALSETHAESGLNEWLARAKPDVVFETTSLNPETGQPAIQY